MTLLNSPPVTATSRRTLILLSPLAVIAVVHFLARWADDVTGDGAWLVVAGAYWLLAVAAVFGFSTPAQRRTWLRPGDRVKWWVYAGAVLLGLFPVAGILLMNLDLLALHPGLILPWLVFALVNPVVEETYWRGLLLDARGRWPFWLMALYSTALFVLSHPLMWGVFSAGNRSAALFGSLAIMGLAWAFIRRATGSLRVPLWSHALVDVGNMSVFVFLNLYVPPGM
ncbi:CPBP family intramembrane glutamic endopeptidase [Crystallibacter degradans]|uniref:CPBP family intramembrane glutamic endopeptidase n=1 Tax=Crystallibacter degradans TaxID=2726743 RepID=UPI00147438F0|nr:CPBP family intramembrane glutamic endopeptidase [Arthrobacter sp. SF27]NMR31966.1 CPBP family intramembrane metalloprotease [Arthrobacter sp. SF27]